jgi:hypothetical protein
MAAISSSMVTIVRPVRLISHNGFGQARRVSSGNRRASGRLWRPISIDRVGHKNASAKQS